jgi:hypothetical protein
MATRIDDCNAKLASPHSVIVEQQVPFTNEGESWGEVVGRQKVKNN